MLALDRLALRVGVFEALLRFDHLSLQLRDTRLERIAVLFGGRQLGLQRV